MTIPLEFWHAVLLLIAFFGCVASFGKILLSQTEKRFNERFKAQEDIRTAAGVHWDGHFSALELAIKNDMEHLRRIERELLDLKASLPVDYIRREDYVRNQVVIEAKLDTVMAEIKNVQLQQRITQS